MVQRAVPPVNDASDPAHALVQPATVVGELKLGKCLAGAFPPLPAVIEMATATSAFSMVGRR
jgi:hypothetical protein